MKSSTKMILLVALVCAAPFVSAWVAYYLIQPQGGKSYGALLPTAPLPALPAGTIPDAERAVWNGKWRMVLALADDCNEACKEVLYATRQARTMLGRERDRVQRVVLVTRAPSAEVRADHPDALFISRPAQMPESWAAPLQRGILLVDPLDNQVLVWPAQPDIKKLNQDLARLLRASRIG